MDLSAIYGFLFFGFAISSFMYGIYLNSFSDLFSLKEKGLITMEECIKIYLDGVNVVIFIKE